MKNLFVYKMDDLLFDSVSFDAVKDSLATLWHDAFGDDYAYIDAFFATIPCEKTVHTLTSGGRVLAALYALPCTFVAGDASLSAAYLYAVATAPDCRGRGYMRLLMQNTVERLGAQGVTMLFLLPADDALRGAYARMGFRDCSYRSMETCLPPAVVSRDYILKEAVSLTDSLCDFIYSCKKNNSPSLLLSRELLAMNRLNCRMQGGGLFAAFSGNKITAVAFVVSLNGRLLILDDCSECGAASEFLFAELCERFSATEYHRLVSVGTEPLAMVRILSSSLPAGVSVDRVNVSLLLDK